MRMPDDATRAYPSTRHRSQTRADQTQQLYTETFSVKGKVIAPMQDNQLPRHPFISMELIYPKCLILADQASGIPAISNAFMYNR